MSVLAASRRAVFITMLILPGFAGGNSAVFSLWLSEQYDTRVLRYGVRVWRGALIIPFTIETPAQRWPE